MSREKPIVRDQRPTPEKGKTDAVAKELLRGLKPQTPKPKTEIRT